MGVVNMGMEFNDVCQIVVVLLVIIDLLFINIGIGYVENVVVIDIGVVSDFVVMFYVLILFY